jgi:hypothetical protein
MPLLAALLGAAYRRWFGSARPSWAWTGYRATQIGAGFLVLAGLNWLTEDVWWRCLLDSGLAVGFMTLPIHISRRPFEWIAQNLNLPVTDGLKDPYRTWLNGYAPWSEVFQGATLWMLAVLV